MHINCSLPNVCTNLPRSQTELCCRHFHSSLTVLNSHRLTKVNQQKRGETQNTNSRKMEATPPPPTEPRKRGRPKGSTKAKAEKDKETSGAAGTPGKMRGSAGDKKNTAGDETYTHWKQLVPVLYDWLASHNLVWPSLSCRYICCLLLFLEMFLVRV